MASDQAPSAGSAIDGGAWPARRVIRAGLAVRAALAGQALQDWGLFAAATGFGVFTFVYLWHDHGPVVDGLDLAAGVVACLALLARRARPAAVGVIAFAAGAFSPLALGAALVAACTAASRARGRGLAAAAAVAVAGSFIWPVANPAAGEILRPVIPAFLFSVIAFGWGLYLRARRELVASLRDRAAQLEADQQRSAELARDAERRRIASEMHDVLAHRLSLLSVHAGALEFRPDAPAADIARAAAVIRTSAAAALGDLRQVITVLREDCDGAAPPPQPGFSQLGDLVEESRSAGMMITSRIDLPDAGELPAAAGRTTYRVVQEGLTNARKHAPGAPVEVTVAKDGQAGVVAEVISHRPGTEPPAPARLPGAGAGLIGLAERLELVGGGLEHGPTLAGGFLLRATIPVGT